MKPNLRFKEFTDNWQTVKLEDICLKSQSGGTPKSDIHDYYNGSIPFLSINDMTTQGKYITKTKKYLTQKGIENSSAWIVPINSILYSMYASVGFVSINKIELSTSQAIINLIINKENKIEYIYYYLCFYKQYLHKFIEKGTQGNLNAKTVRNFHIKLPSIQEQEKIANFFSLIDRRIDILTKLKIQLENYKKSTSQKLFNQELRFPEFTEEWQTVKLEDICLKSQSGGTPKSDIHDYYNGSIPFLSINDMTTQGKYITKTKKYLTKKGIENSSAWIVPINSILYSMYASVGFVSINKIELSTSQAIINLIINKENKIEYIYYYLCFYKQYLHKFIEKGTQGNLNAKTVRNFHIKLPSIQEQEKIANFLSHLDTKINNINTQITTTTQYKKYLLQNMLI